MDGPKGLGEYGPRGQNWMVFSNEGEGSSNKNRSLKGEIGPYPNMNLNGFFRFVTISFNFFMSTFLETDLDDGRPRTQRAVLQNLT